ncbi:MAG: L17 family ribosomal protein [Candidatus Hodgkinia cicadicola]
MVIKNTDLAIIKSFIIYGRVVSITQRLKDAKPKLEALISLAKRNNERYRLIRLVRARLRCTSEFAARVLLMAKLCGSANGGYVKLLKLGKRRGDGAHMSIMISSMRLPLAYCS